MEVRRAKVKERRKEERRGRAEETRAHSRLGEKVRVAQERSRHGEKVKVTQERSSRGEKAHGASSRGIAVSSRVLMGRREVLVKAKGVRQAEAKGRAK